MSYGEAGMKLLVINPNTDETFTELIAGEARKGVFPGTEIVCESAPGAPRFIETHRDEVLCAPGMMALAEKHRQVDGVVIACTCDPNLDVLREILDCPVVGAGESSMLLALTLGARFSVLQTTEGSVQAKRELVAKYGLSSRCASVRPILEGEGATLEGRLIAAGKKARDLDGAEVITLGCAGLSGLDSRLSEALGIPVVDGVLAGVKLAEALASREFATSRRGKYRGE